MKGRERQLADALAAQIELKCQLLDKRSAVKEYAEIQSSLGKSRKEKESESTPALPALTTK